MLRMMLVIRSVCRTLVTSFRGRRDAGPRGALDDGMATAEYAIATVAACAFAGMLVAVLRSDEVRGLLSDIIRRALSVG
jgi:Protein of unknown function (DUF4244)